MDSATLNGYVGRAKRISQTISWVNLKNEMRQAGATNEEILYVARFIQKGPAKEKSVTNPITLIEIPVKTKPVLLCGYQDADIPFMSYDPFTRTVHVSRSCLNG